jgi:hypothetical protein
MAMTAWLYGPDRKAQRPVSRCRHARSASRTRPWESFEVGDHKALLRLRRPDRRFRFGISTGKLGQAPSLFSGLPVADVLTFSRNLRAPLSLPTRSPARRSKSVSVLCGWPEATAAEDLIRGQIAANYPSNYGKLAGGAARPSASKTPSRNRPGSRSSSLAS